MTNQSLSDFQQSKILHKFDMLDVDKNGVIEFEDFQMVIGALSSSRGWSEDDPRFQMLVKTSRDLWGAIQRFCDVNEDDCVTEKEWVDFHTQAVLKARDFDHLVPGFETTIDAFATLIHVMLDVDGDGMATEEDFLQMSRAQGIEDDAARKIFDIIDEDSNGLLSKDEVIELVRQYYLSNDPSAPGNEFFGEILR
jgi:Ca2+-binding EF-hand superfamily protein